MASNIQVYNRYAGIIDGQDISGGSLEKPVSVSVDGELHRQVFTVANAANTALYANQVGTFDYLAIESDFDLRLLITDNASASFSLTIKGSGESGKYGIPFQLGADETSNSTTTINALQVFNTSGNTAKVRVTVID